MMDSAVFLSNLKKNLSNMKHHFCQHCAIFFIYKINTNLSSYSLDPQGNQEVHIHHPAIHSYNHISGQLRYRYPVQYNFLSLVGRGHLDNLFHHSNCLEIRPKKILVFSYFKYSEHTLYSTSYISERVIAV